MKNGARETAEAEEPGTEEEKAVVRVEPAPLPVVNPWFKASNHPSSPPPSQLSAQPSENAPQPTGLPFYCAMASAGKRCVEGLGAKGSAGR